MGVARANQPMLLAMRSRRECHWYRYGRAGYSVDAYDLTEQCGLFSLGVIEGDDWYTDQPIALVGSERDFWIAEFLGENEPIGAYIFVDKANERRLISWLQSKQRAPKLYLYFNFDSHGVLAADQFISQVPEADFFLPADIASIWEKHSKMNLFNPEHFERVRDGLKQQNPAVQQIVGLMSRTKTALPLESLALTAKAEEFE